MGYFSNGTEGMDYQDRYCAKCVHDSDERPCPVWSAHLFHSGIQHRNEPVREILTALIPRSKMGTANEQCAMFIEKSK